VLSILRADATVKGRPPRQGNHRPEGSFWRGRPGCAPASHCQSFDCRRRPGYPVLYGRAAARRPAGQLPSEAFEPEALRQISPRLAASQTPALPNE